MLLLFSDIKYKSFVFLIEIPKIEFKSDKYLRYHLNNHNSQLESYYFTIRFIIMTSENNSEIYFSVLIKKKQKYLYFISENTEMLLW